MQTQYDIDKATAEDERIPACALRYLLAAHHIGCDHALDELIRGFSFLIYPIAERIGEVRSHRPQHDLLAIMFDDLARILLARRKKPIHASKLEAHLRRELSNVLKHEAEEKNRNIKDKHHGANAGSLKHKTKTTQLRDGTTIAAYDDPTNSDLRRYGRGKWRKPRGVDLPVTVSDERERRRHRSGWYDKYVSRAEIALKYLRLSRDEAEILRHAAAGNGPEEIERMTKFNAGYVAVVLRNIEERIKELSAA